MDIEEALKPCLLPKVVDAKDLIVGEWYWVNDSLAQYHDEAGFYGVCYFGATRLWADERTIFSDTGWSVYGPIPRPDTDVAKKLPEEG